MTTQTSISLLFHAKVSIYLSCQSCLSVWTVKPYTVHVCSWSSCLCSPVALLCCFSQLPSLASLKSCPCRYKQHCVQHTVQGLVFIILPSAYKPIHSSYLQTLTDLTAITYKRKHTHTHTHTYYVHSYTHVYICLFISLATDSSGATNGLNVFIG